MTDSISRGYGYLADAILKQAVEDYRKTPVRRKEIERFVASDWFDELSGDCDKDFFLTRMRKAAMDHMEVTLVNATPDPIQTIAQTASICYDSDPKDPEQLVKHLYNNGHHSVFEHVVFQFKVTGISRACSHQLVRHRHASYTQRSQRYCSESKYNVVVPPSITEHPVAYEAYTEAVEHLSLAYDRLMRLGIKREDARYILPNAQETELYVSLNLRELILLANERRCLRAQWEIRSVVTRMCQLVDPALRWMLVPKCQSGRIVCNNPCHAIKKEDNV